MQENILFVIEKESMNALNDSPTELDRPFDNDPNALRVA
jgi:hypothetical protein